MVDKIKCVMDLPKSAIPESYYMTPDAQELQTQGALANKACDVVKFYCPEHGHHFAEVCDGNIVWLKAAK